MREVQRQATYKRNVLSIMKKIYISGPISGYDINERKDAFAKAQEVLELCGYEVRNPFDNGLDREASTHEHMRADLKMLLDCDEILMLKGWNRSAGCNVELQCAVAAGLEVCFESNATPSAIVTPIGGLSLMQTDFE